MFVWYGATQRFPMASSVNTLGGPMNLKNIVIKSALNDSGFNFAHINPGSLKPNLDEVAWLIKDVNLHILAISETWFTPKHNLNLLKIKDFDLIRHDRNNVKRTRGGGVALYVRNGLKNRIIAKSRANALIEYLCIEITSGLGEKLAFCTAYNPPQNTRFDPLMSELNKLAPKYSHVIVVGDFNVNLLKDNPPAKRFVEEITKCGFSCPNNIPTNFVIGKNPSLIDLILLKQKNCLNRCSQISCGSFTSHDMIFGSYEFKLNFNSFTQKKLVRNIKSLDEKSLNSAAYDYDWDKIYELPDIDMQLSHLTNILSDMLNTFAPLIESSDHFDHNTCFKNPKLTHLINSRNFYHLAARKEKNLFIRKLYRNEYKMLRNRVTTTKRKIKAQSVAKDLSPSLPSKILWKNLKKHGITSNTTNCDDNFTPKEFNDYFTSVFTQNPPSPEIRPNGNENSNSFNFTCVTNDETFRSIMSLTSNATGEDGIPAIFIKKLCPFIIPFITYIINGCFTKS